MFLHYARLAANRTTVKAISVKQPWANRIASGKKTIETRVWETSYRGKLLIVSSKQPKIEPAGYAVAVADLIDCRKMTKADEGAAGCAIYAGAYAWVLENIRPIKDPFPVNGKLKLYDVTVPRSIIAKKKKELPQLKWDKLRKLILDEVFGNDQALMKKVTKKGTELDPESSEVFLIFLQDNEVEFDDPDLIAEAFKKFIEFLSEKLKK